MGPEISIIITSYNVERYIERAVRSALDQQGVSLEVIAVDDASTDGSWQKLTAIYDPRLHTIRLEKNLGPGAARNAAIAKATGAWIAILDGDDAFLPGRLAHMLALAKGKQANIVVDNLIVQREDGSEFTMFKPSRWSHLDTLNHAAFIAGNCSLSGYTLGYLKPIFSADFLRAHQLIYNTDTRIGEDYFLLAEALAAGARCAVDTATGYIYTLRAGSTSHRIAAADIKRIQDADVRYLARYCLSEKTKKAQTKRESAYKTANAYALLIDAIKAKNTKGVMNAILLRPACIWLLWQPLGVRIERLMGRRK